MILPDYPQEGQPLSATWARRVVDAIRALRPVTGSNMKIQEVSGGMSYSALVSALGGGSFPGRRSFDIISTAGANVTLRKGALRILGIGNAVLVDTAVTITSADAAHPTWIYLQRNKTSGDVTMECTDTDGGPIDTSDLWCFPLYCMHLDAKGNAVLDHDWRDDVRAGTPIG